MGNTFSSLVCLTLALHLSPLEFCGTLRLFDAACLLFSITTSTLAKGGILFFAKSTIACTLCGRQSKGFEERYDTGE
jgi:hypothetical protein